MRVRSILKTGVHVRLVRLDSTMRCAMIERMRLSGTSSPGCGAGAAGAAGLAAAGAGAAVRWRRDRSGRGLRCCRLLDVGEDVFLGDASS